MNGPRRGMFLTGRNAEGVVQFTIDTEHGYVATRKQKGWLASQVFGKSFRLTSVPRPDGRATFRLDVR